MPNKKNQIIEWLEAAVVYLEKHSKNFGADFVALKRVFFVRFQNGNIFSTRFGANFFEEILFKIKNNLILTADDGKLGEYDTNFNNWLKSLK